MARNNATMLKNGHLNGAKKYHDHGKLPHMVLLDLARQPLGNTMKNTIDNADYMVICADLPFTNQNLINPGYSHSMVAGGFPEMS